MRDQGLGSIQILFLSLFSELILRKKDRIKIYPDCSTIENDNDLLQLPVNLGRRVFEHVISKADIAAMAEKGSDAEMKIFDLPMNGETIYMDRKSILGRSLTKAFQKDEDSRSLFFIKSGIMTHNDVVQDNVDVRNLVAVERCNEGIRRSI